MKFNIIPKKPKNGCDWFRLILSLVGTLLEVYIIWLFMTEYGPYIERIKNCEIYYQEKIKATYEKFNISWQQNMSWDDLIESNMVNNSVINSTSS